MDTQQEAARVVRQEVGRMLRFGLPSRGDDLSQAGWVAAMRALSRYRSGTKVPLSAYLRLVVRRHLRGEVAGDLAVVHVADHQKWHARDYQARVDPAGVESLLPSPPTPEEHLLAAERAAALAAWRRRVRDALHDMADALPATTRRASLAVLLESRRPREAARERAVPVRDIYTAVGQLRRRVAESPALARLWVERAGIDEGLRYLGEDYPCP